MARSFKIRVRAPGVRGQWRDPKYALRVVLGVLVAMNLIAAALVLFPIGGSAEDLERQLTNLRAQLQAKQALLERTRQHASAVEKGRTEGDRFLTDYFLSTRNAYSTLLSELVAAADKAKITPGEHAYATEPIEGSDSLSMMTITANYQGTYADLMHFVHELDQSPRLLIVKSLTAAPVQGSGKLSVSMKLDTFVRENTADRLAGTSRESVGGG